MASKSQNQNHPYVVWSTCFLWLTSMFTITWSLLLFICVSDMLEVTGMDMINGVVLLLGIIMLPTNVHMLCAIANGKRIDPKSSVVCCPLWLCIVWIIIIAFVGAVLCIQRVYFCQVNYADLISKGMQNYRNVPKYKRFMDNLQWSFKCCGLNSFKDWFSRDWYDKIRDYEWEPSTNRGSVFFREKKAVADSVPLSCCKSGSCISNYLLELGTHSINTSGCGHILNDVIIISMTAHFTMFIIIILVELLCLKMILRKEKNDRTNIQYDIKHIMSVNNRFVESSLSPEDSNDDDEKHEEDMNG